MSPEEFIETLKEGKSLDGIQIEGLCGRTITGSGPENEFTKL